MQSATGQYSTHAGDPAHPVQHSLMTARMCGLRLRCVVVPVDLGSYLTTDPSLNSSMLGAPYAIKILHEWAAVSYSCRHRTCCQSGRSVSLTHIRYPGPVVLADGGEELTQRALREDTERTENVWLNLKFEIWNFFETPFL